MTPLAIGITIGVVILGLILNVGAAVFEERWATDNLTRKGRIAYLVFVAIPWLFLAIEVVVIIYDIVIIWGYPKLRSWVNGEQEMQDMKTAMDELDNEQRTDPPFVADSYKMEFGGGGHLDLLSEEMPDDPRERQTWHNAWHYRSVKERKP